MNVDELSDINAAATAELSEDDALGAVWDEVSSQGEAERGADGRFSSKTEDVTAPEGDGAQEDAAEPVEGEEAPKADDAPPAVALPANWNRMDEDWKKIPADVQAKIAARDTELHARMSEQGRQIGSFKPIADVLDRNQDLLQGKTMPDGRPVTMNYAVDWLMNAHRQIEADPVRSLIQIADRYGARDMLAAVLTGQAQIPSAPSSAPAGILPAEVQRMVKEAMTETSHAQAMTEELGRLSRDKPLYAEIAEPDMVYSIQKARQKLGEAASNDAVFSLAYDMAVNADPDLRAKAAAPSKAAAPDPKRAADVRRATSVNVSSTSTGKSRAPTEDELLGQAYEAAKNKD